MISTTTQAKRPVTIRCPLCLKLNRVDLSKLSQGPKCAECARPLLLDRPVTASDADLDQTVATGSVPILVDFYADWCGPCKITAPILDEFARERAGDVLVLKLDTDRNPQSTMRFGVRGIPTLIAFREGKEVRRHVGAADRATLDSLVS